MSDPGVILLVTWDGGGNVPPMLALGRRLARRGHVVRVLGPSSLRDQVTSVGLDFTAFALVTELDRAPGRAMEDQVETFVGTLAGSELGADVVAELARRRPDVVVIDCMQLAAFNAAEASELSTFSLVHFLPCFAVESGLNGLTSLLNVSRSSLGIEPFDVTVGLYEQQWARCTAVLAATVPQLDDRAQPIPANLHYVGPILDPDAPDWSWDLPWPPDHPDPVVVVSFSSTYQHQEQQLQNVLDALALLPVHTLATVGHALEPNAIDAPPNAVVRQWIPHAAVFASVLVTHAGHSTVMNALAHGIPMVCVPTGRDQHLNAARVHAIGAGIALEPDADPRRIRAAVSQLLTTPTYRTVAQQMATTIQEMTVDEPAVTAIESAIET